VAGEILVDGAVDFTGGQDASRVADRIGPSNYASGINVSSYRGALRPRWALARRSKKLVFPAGGIKNKAGYEIPFKSIFESGNFQAMAPYKVGPDLYILVVVAGYIFLINKESYRVSYLPIEGGSILNPNADRINWSVAGDFFVLFDWPAPPVILEGIEARRSDLDKNEVPVSVMGTFNQSRLFIANAGGEFTGGDPVGNLLTPDAPITFDEVNTISSPYFGQVFQLPTQYAKEEITAMGFLQVVDTSTGIGPLLLATKDAIFSYASNTPRANWEAGQFGSIIVYNAGIAGPRALTNVNSDFIFLSADGQVRSLSMSRDEQSKWSKVPISREVQNWLKVWDADLTRYGSITYFNNKLFITCNPFRANAQDINGVPRFDYAHGGFVVMEMDNLSAFAQDSRPSWAGLWTGVMPMDACVIDEQMFIMGKDNGSLNALYEYLPESTYDTDGQNIRYVRSRMYSREFDFQDPFANKELLSIDLSLENMQGDVKLDVKYKPGQSANYLPWKTFKQSAPWRNCMVPKLAKSFAGYTFRDMKLGSPPSEACDPVTLEYYRIFKKMQFYFEIEAINWELHEYRIKTILKPQNETETLCEEYPPKEVYLDCLNDWNPGVFESCEQTKT